MSNTRNTGFLTNVVKYTDKGDISFVSGSTTLMSISSSGAVTVTGVISGSNALTSSYSQNSELLDNLDSTSFVFTSSFNTYSSSMSTRVTNNESTGSTLTTASASFAVVSSSYSSASGSLSTRVTRIEGNYATTGSNVFLGAQTVCANITSTGTIIAQTLNVQQVTSSVVYSSGSNVFGNDVANTQTFTGSMLITGSVRATGNICATGTGCFGVICSPTHVGGTFSGTNATFSGNVYINTSADGNSCLQQVQAGINATTLTTTTIKNLGVKLGFTGVTNTAGYIFGGIAMGGNGEEYSGIVAYDDGASAATGLKLYTGTNAAVCDRLTIFSTGIACFSCRVCVPSLTAAGTITTTVSPGAYQADMTYLGTTFNLGASEVTDTIDFKICGASASTAGNGFAFWTQPGNTTPSQRFRIDKNGIACFACQVCTTQLISSDCSSTSYNSIILSNTCTGATSNKNVGILFRLRDTVGTFKCSALIETVNAASSGNVDWVGLRFMGYCNDYASEFMRINSCGNVGIGTTSILGSSVERTLHLAAPASGYATLYVTNSTNTLKGIFAIADTTSKIFIGSQSNTDFGFVTNDTERMRITSGGIACFAGRVCAPTATIPTLTADQINLTNTVSQTPFGLSATAASTNQDVLSIGNERGVWLVSVQGFGGNNSYFAHSAIVYSAAYEKSFTDLGQTNHFGNSTTYFSLSTTSGASAAFRFCSNQSISGGTVFVLKLASQ